MRDLLILPRALLLAGLWLAGLASAAEIMLPIEVLGPVGTTRTVTVASSAPATALSLRVHGLAHGDSGEVRIDSGAWIALNNTNATVAGMGARFGGVGMFATLDLRVPIASTPAGSHAISFRFAHGDGVNMGFRVLRLDLLTANGASTVAASSFRHDDPATWAPPIPGAADRDAGEALWRTAPLVEGIGGPSIRARCGDCHAQDGRDLSYFNYSNLAIIERSKFHGLSDTQAKQIASYIRSLPGSVNGRPWNPPYQPGPGLTSRPVSEWSAGAGIDAVASEDADAMKYVPGAGGDAREILDEDGRIRDLPIHDMPIALQLLDWNHWLPRVHPMDAPGFDYASSEVKLEYEKVRQTLAGANARDAFANRADTFFDRFRDAWGRLEAKVVPEIDFDAANRVVTLEQAQRIYSANLWGTVKLWELMQEFDLEGRGKLIHGANAPVRQWYSYRFIFDASPFLSGLPDSITLFGDGPDGMNHEYANNSWYELQMQLNAGHGGRSSGGHGTIDWTYMSQHFGNSGDFFPDEPIRRTMFNLMGMQQHNNYDQPLNHDHDGRNGFAETDGWDYASADVGPLDREYWSLVPNPKPLVQALSQTRVEIEARYTHEQWRDAAGDDDEGLPNWDYVLGSAHNPDVNYAEYYFKDFKDARDVHRIDEAVVNGMAAVGKVKWPNNDWDKHRRATATIAAPVACTATSGVGGIQIAWSAVPGATSYNLYRSNHASEWFAPIQLRIPGTTATDRRLTPGDTWYYCVTANDGGKEAPSRSPVASAGVARGLVARWAFDESGQRIVDASGLRNHGELIGAVQRIVGKHGGALRITAKEQFASVTYNLLPTLLRNATITAWVRSSAPANKPMTVFGGSHWFGFVYGDGKPSWRIQDESGIKAKTPILDGQWHHLAISYATNSTATVWVDGTLEATGQVPFRSPGNKIHDLGRGPQLNGEDTTWLGDLDDIRLYDQILGESEIRSVMNDDSTGPSTIPEGEGGFTPGVPDVPTATGSLGAGSGGGGKGCGLGSGLTVLLTALALGSTRRRRVV